MQDAEIDLEALFESEQEFESPNARSLAVIKTRTIVGVQAIPVMVEVHLANGLPCFTTVGLAEAAVRESRERVRGAILNSGFDFPAKRITVNLAPADLPKSGGHFDLAIAVGILIASGQIPSANVDLTELFGELALDGSLRKVSGVLPAAMACQEQGHRLILPSQNAGEASLVRDLSCWQADHLLQVCSHLVGKDELRSCAADALATSTIEPVPDMADVKGQPQAKRALEVAASGGHSALLIGPPGTGKSMLASRLPGILPDLSQSEALESAVIRSVADGFVDQQHWQQRSYRSPHHSCSAVAMVGGGSNPRPGEISMAHNGILFLDELTEFQRNALEQLREPLETGQIHIARASQSVTYPAKFQLIAACNPCPCGYLGDGTERCQCSLSKIERYRHKLSGPMLDRIDIHLQLSRISPAKLRARNLNEEGSQQIRQRVKRTRQLQHSRQHNLNCDLSADEFQQHCRLSNEDYQFLDAVADKLHLSARAYHRILRIARTIADMAQAADIEKSHLAEAISYRRLDRH